MKRTLQALVLCCTAFFIYSCQSSTNQAGDVPVSDRVVYATEGEREGDDEYESPEDKYRFEFERTKDPVLGYVPAERMITAIEYTNRVKDDRRRRRQAGALTWEERGPTFDLVGPSNGNIRGGAGTNYTAGRTRALLIDTLNDPSGNTVYCGSAAGGLWKTTNFLTGGNSPNWVPLDERFENMAIAYICQDPKVPATLYFATGEPYGNADAVYGAGIWKSVNNGATWTRIAATTGFRRVFRLVCDGDGNLYLAHRGSTTPAASASGLYRSTNGGNNWENITPSSIAAANAVCSDLEFSAAGRLHASFGYGSGTVVHHYTDDPATVTAGAGWMASTGIRENTTVAANRLELAVAGNVLYAVTINNSNNTDSCYKSTDGGQTWARQNTTVYPSAITNTQGWYDLTLSINPANTDEIIVAGVDAYKSTNSGNTVSRLTFWVQASPSHLPGVPYVHADHHFMQWGVAGSASRVVIGGDGGIFVSDDNGATFLDKNRNLAIKQFYAGSIHPAAGSNYMIGGTQDNGTHQLNQAGKGSSVEVFGGDGGYTAINQQNPSIQFGTTVFNQYRRSTHGGASWSSLSFSNSAGRFINPYDYDDGQNTMYACWGSNTVLRWPNANTSNSASLLTLSGLAGIPSAFKVSPFTKDRLFVGAGNGRLVRLDSAGTVNSAAVPANLTDLSASLPAGYLNCVNTGSSDNVLVATYTSFGVPHVWVSTNGGAAWTNIDGNLPDMPVRWAVFDPQNDNRMFIATEAGVYYTDAINGAATQWTSDPSFPVVRTDMLRIRLSDNTIMAATHGRGIYTAVIPATPEIRFGAQLTTLTERTTGTVDCRGYTDYTVDVNTLAAPTGDATVTYVVDAGGTAIEGVDFDFTTNGNFAAPSNQHVFQSGAVSPKTVTIRVYDDAAIEPTKTFSLHFTVSGTTNAFAGAYDFYTVSILDNDVAPLVFITPTDYSVGNSGSLLALQSAFRSNQPKHRLQILVRAAELVAAGVPALGGDIMSLADTVLTKNSTKPFKNYTISMANTTATNLSSNFQSGLTQVYTGDYSSVEGENKFTFGTGAGSASFFRWDGTSNVVIQFCFDNSADGADGNADVMSGNAPFGTGSSAANYPTIYSNALSAGTGAGCALAAANISNFRINLRFGIGVAGQPVAQFASSKSSYLGPEFDVPFFNSGNNILARINSSSNFNFGCTEVAIDRAGVTALPFWNNTQANYIMSKTYRITPATNNASGQYTLTLYFTKAEKEGWEAATGNSWSNIQLIKTEGPISAVTPGNPLAAGSVQIVMPTHGTFGPDFTLSHTFSSGFSGFGAGIVGFPLPIVLLDFQGRVDNNASLLTWTTSFEQNARDFDVEKSTDGINFYKIGSVDATGNSSARRAYSFRDKQLAPQNYYRLRMNDRDAKFRQSSVVLISYSAAVQKVTVVNNPFRNGLDVRFAKPGATARLQLVSVSGAVVAEKQLGSPSGQVHWALPGNLSNGAYILRTVVDGVVFTEKLIKQ